MGQSSKSTRPSSRLIRLFHTTKRASWFQSIRTTGIQHTASRGARQEVWLTAKRLVCWARDHTKQRKSTDSTVTLEVVVSEEEITRRRDGIYTIARTIHPSEIISVNGLRVFNPN